MNSNTEFNKLFAKYHSLQAEYYSLYIESYHGIERPNIEYLTTSNEYKNVCRLLSSLHQIVFVQDKRTPLFGSSEMNNLLAKKDIREFINKYNLMDIIDSNSL